jgi:hypothetical protein
MSVEEGGALERTGRLAHWCPSRAGPASGVTGEQMGGNGLSKCIVVELTHVRVKEGHE